MTWAHPLHLLFFLPALALVVWSSFRSRQPTSTRRHRALLGLRVLALALLVLALAAPSCEHGTGSGSVAFVLDESESLGPVGREVVRGQAERLASSFGDSSRVATLATHPAHATDLAAAIDRAVALLSSRPAPRRLVVVSDGLETLGDASQAAARAAAVSTRVDCVAVPGVVQPDVRVTRLRAGAAWIHEGAPVALDAELVSTTATQVTVVLIENETQVATRTMALRPFVPEAVRFERTPPQSGLYRYVARLGERADDAVRANDEGYASVEVGGRARVLLVEGQAREGRALAAALTAHRMTVSLVAPDALPPLAPFDAVVLANVPAIDVDPTTAAALTLYVQQGGSFVMIGGPRSFGAGGYQGTPVAALLPVDVRPRERDETALVLVLDRSGSMRGTKITLCKSAALAAAETLRPQDRIGIVAFDVEPRWIAEMMPAGESQALRARVATLNAAGGTNILPAIATGLEALRLEPARVKHMIVLSDGRTQAGSYEALARRAAALGITVSTVGIGEGADRDLLATIATVGGGAHYTTRDATDLPRIFTTDTAAHAGGLVRTTPFVARTRDRHPMLAGWDPTPAGPLGGYVRTEARPTAGVSLLAEGDDPLLAHWRVGRGLVIAFTSDAASRWASTWLTNPPIYSRFWTQVLRDATETRSSSLAVRITREHGSVRVIAEAAGARGDLTAEVTSRDADGRGALRFATLPMALEDRGGGRFEGRLVPTEAGIYRVQVNQGNANASTGFGEPLSTETTEGGADVERLRAIARAGGGVVIEGSAPLPPSAAGYVDLTPTLLRLFLLVYLLGLVVRRFESVARIYEVLRRRTRRGQAT